MENSAQTLPALRQDLRLRQGAPSLSGHATWLIYDPVRHRYYSVSERVYQVISLWTETTAQELAIYAGDTLDTHFGAEEIRDIEFFLHSNNLTDTPPNNDPFSYARQSEAAKRNLFSTALHNYLFFKIPVWRPETFLKASYPYVRPLFSSKAIYTYLVALFIGLYFVSRQWDEFLSTFIHFFTFDGVVLYVLSLIFIKTLHEMGHAYMAHRYGVRVNTMGVAFLVMLPVLYTDVTDAWSLKSRKEKLMIDGAGLFVELAIAAIATFLWVFLPDGPLRSAAFLLATTSWILSLFINLNPFMRFDGYYILADAWGMPNLQPRAFAQMRWWIREKLFGLGKPSPESFSINNRRLLIAYALGTSVYRFFLFIGIALLVYHMFFKLLGVALFSVEIMFFILLPIWRELKEWWKLKAEISRTRRTVFTATVTAMMVAIMIIPWNSQVRVPAVMSGGTDITVFAKNPAQIIELTVREGMIVKKGDVLLKLASPILDENLTNTVRKVELLKARIARVAGDRSDLSNLQILARQLDTEKERYEGLRREGDQLQIRAPADGQVKDIDPNLHVGRWINHTKPLLSIIGSQITVVKGYVKEEHLWRLSKGQSGLFVPDNPLLQKSRVSLDALAPTGTSTLDSLYLSSIYGGPIATNPEEGNRLSMTEGRYLLKLSSENRSGNTALRGVVLLEGKAESYLKAMWRQVTKVLIRESSL